MQQQIEQFVISTAQQEAHNQLNEIEYNFINTDYFNPAPGDEAALKACYQALLESEDEPWWYCWQMIADEIPDMMNEQDDVDTTLAEAKKLLQETFENTVLDGLKRHYQF